MPRISNKSCWLFKKILKIKRERIYVYLELIHALQQKPTQHWKVIINQSKQERRKRKEEGSACESKELIIPERDSVQGASRTHTKENEGKTLRETLQL